MLEAITIETNHIRLRHRRSVAVFDDDLHGAMKNERAKTATTIENLQTTFNEAHPQIEVSALQSLPVAVSL